MYKQYFGKRNKMKFGNQEEYYETIGFLAKSDNSIELVWEDNDDQGAWGKEGRIHCLSNLNKFTPPLKREFTKGKAKKVLHRINCNEFVKNLEANHNFSMGSVQNTNAIRNSIPIQYLAAFDRGLAL